MAADPKTEATKIMDLARKRANDLSLEILRRKVTNTLAAINRAADNIPEYIANEVFGQSRKPTGDGWEGVHWEPLSEDYNVRKAKLGTYGQFFQNSGSLISEMGNFRMGQAFGRAYALINGVRPIGKTWSNIKPFNSKAPITIEFFPFLKVGSNMPSKSRTWTYAVAMAGGGEEIAAKLVNKPEGEVSFLNNQGKVRTKSVDPYRPVLEPTLIHFSRVQLRAVTKNAITRQGL